MRVPRNRSRQISRRLSPAWASSMAEEKEH
jgi:hypothetical protein